MELSATQQRILNLMANNWELGKHYGVNTRYWIQQGGLGRGGKSENLKGSTVRKLLYAGLITGLKTDTFTTKYELA